LNFRWFVKRGLKWGLEWTTELSGAGILYRGSQYFHHGYRILTYHHIAKTPPDSHSLSIRHFQEHIAFLKDHYPIVSLPQLVSGLKNELELSKGSVCITFDDGYSEAVGAVGEILLKHNVNACFFVITGVLDGTQKPYGTRYMNWDDVRNLKKSGFGVGSHTVSHRSLGNLNPEEMEQELRDSYNRLLSELHTPPDGLSYPYGTYRDFSDLSIATAVKCGYPYAVTAIHGLNQAGCDLFRLKRTTITAGDGLKTIKMIMKGDLDGWRFVDEWAYRLQRTSSSLE